MPHWSHQIKIRQYLTEYDSRAAQLSAAEGISKEVKALPEALWQRGGKDFCTSLGKAAKTGNIDWFNASLTRLWDWFDEQRIWVEL